jgi:hypothetical protein
VAMLEVDGLLASAQRRRILASVRIRKARKGTSYIGIVLSFDTTGMKV